MSCNAVDLQNIYFWLILSAGGVGGAIGALLTALWRSLKRSSFERRSRIGGSGPPEPRARLLRSRAPRSSLLVKVSLLLSAAALAILGGIIFLDLPQIEWTRSIFYFSLWAVLGWTLVYVGFRWLIIPLILVAVLYIVLVSGVVRQWGCCQPNDQLLRMKVIAQQSTVPETGEAAESAMITRVEIHGPDEGSTGFQEFEGDAVKVVLSSVRFKPWVFYPRCAFLFRVHTITGLTSGSAKAEVGPGAADIDESGMPLSVLLQFGIVEMEPIEIVQTDLQVLSSYVLAIEQNSPQFRSQR